MIRFWESVIYKYIMKSRLLYIDNLKCLLILLVVLGHCLQDTGCDSNNVLFRFIYSFHIPLFMAVSGYVSQKKNTPWATIQKRALQLVVPFLAWGIIKSCITPTIQLLDIIKYPDKGLWFLLALFFITLIIKLCEEISKATKINIGIVIFSSVAVLYYIAFYIRFQLFGIQFVAWQLPFYCLGWYIKNHSFTLNKQTAAIMLVISIFASCLWHEAQITNTLATHALSPHAWEIIQSVVCACLAIVSYISFFKFYCDKRIAIIDWIGKHTLPLYAVSLTSVSLYCLMFTQISPYIPYGLSILCIFVSTILFATTIISLFKRNKVLSLVFLGSHLKGESKNA